MCRTNAARAVHERFVGPEYKIPKVGLSMAWRNDINLRIGWITATVRLV